METSADYGWDDAFTAPTDADHAASLFDMLVQAVSDQLPPRWEGKRYKRRLTETTKGRLYVFWSEPPGEGSEPDPDCLWHIYPLAAGQTRFVGYCFDPTWQPFCEAVSFYFESLFPAIAKEKAPQRPHGTQGGTLDRVREARELLKSGEAKNKTEACKRVSIDTRTYDKYADLFVDWDDAND